MEIITVAPDSSVVRSLKYLEAARRLQLPWLEIREFGGSMGGWPADIAILKVRGRATGAGPRGRRTERERNGLEALTGM